MAPEQAAGQPESTGPWTDLYSVGIVFFEMLTGQLPYEGATLAVLGKIVHEPPPALSRFRPYLDARLEAILLKALHKEPEAPFRSHRQFNDASAALAVTTLTTSMPAQMENQATPNHSPSERNATRTTWVQIAARVFGVVATAFGVGLFAGGIAATIADPVRVARPYDKRQLRRTLHGRLRRRHDRLRHFDSGMVVLELGTGTEEGTIEINRAERTDAVDRAGITAFRGLALSSRPGN